MMASLVDQEDESQVGCADRAAFKSRLFFHSHFTVGKADLSHVCGISSSQPSAKKQSDQSLPTTNEAIARFLD
jgi:hypothetical protein